MSIANYRQRFALATASHEGETLRFDSNSRPLNVLLYVPKRKFDFIISIGEIANCTRLLPIDKRRLASRVIADQ